MDIKGYWTGYSYKGYVGKDVAGADKDGYMKFVDEHDYEAWVK